MFITGANDTGEKFITGMKKNYPSKFFAFIAGVIGTPDNVHSQLSPRIFEKIRNNPNGILIGPGGH